MTLFRALGYFISRGLKNIWHNRLMSLASVGIVAASLVLFGVFLLLGINVNALLGQLEGQCQINVYLSTDTQGMALSQIEESLRHIEGVESIQFLSREDRLAKVKQERYQGREELLEDLEEDNPLRDVYLLTAADLNRAEEIARQAAGIPGVDEVANLQDAVEWVRGAAGLVRRIGFWLMLILGLAAMLIVANTIRLGLLSRSREVNIMRYVGASNWYIRGPFMVEGLLLGSLGAALAGALALWGYGAALDTLRQSSVADFLELASLASVRRPVLGGSLGLGAGIGLLGSAVSIRKYLRV